MSEKYAADQRQALVNRYLSGESVSSISATTGIPRSPLYTWVKASQEQNSKTKPVIDKRYVQTLEKKVQRLEGLHRNHPACRLFPAGTYEGAAICHRESLRSI